MMTKETEELKKCCLYASEFHLEMILLPFIREKNNKVEFIIFTQNDLSKTINMLLDRVNINKEEKQKILNYNWKKYKEIDIEKIFNNKENIEVIVNGDCKFIEEINYKIKQYNSRVNIIDCFYVNDADLEINNIKHKYDIFLNTTKI